jgi:hypothetical protein
VSSRVLVGFAEPVPGRNGTLSATSSATTAAAIRSATVCALGSALSRQRDPVRTRGELPLNKPAESVVVHLPSAVNGVTTEAIRPRIDDRFARNLGRRLDDRCLIDHLVADVLLEGLRGLEAMRFWQIPRSLLSNSRLDQITTTVRARQTLPIARSGMNSNADLRVVSISSPPPRPW